MDNVIWQRPHRTFPPRRMGRGTHIWYNVSWVPRSLHPSQDVDPFSRFCVMYIDHNSSRWMHSMQPKPSRVTKCFIFSFCWHGRHSVYNLIIGPAKPALPAARLWGAGRMLLNTKLIFQHTTNQISVTAECTVTYRQSQIPNGSSEARSDCDKVTKTATGRIAYSWGHRQSVELSRLRRIQSLYGCPRFIIISSTRLCQSWAVYCRVCTCAEIKRPTVSSSYAGRDGKHLLWYGQKHPAIKPASKTKQVGHKFWTQRPRLVLVRWVVLLCFSPHRDAAVSCLTNDALTTSSSSTNCYDDWRRVSPTVRRPSYASSPFHRGHLLATTRLLLCSCCLPLATLFVDILGLVPWYRLFFLFTS